MKRNREQFRIRVTDDRRGVEREFIAGRDFQLSSIEITDRLLLPLFVRMHDMLRIAAAVYVADRLVMRDRKRSGTWSRTISCSVEVRQPGFWSDVSVHDTVNEAVSYVSGDEWYFDFVNDVSPNEHRLQQMISESFDVPPVVSLYSGGLDSAAGMARRLQGGINGPVIPVVVRHRPDIVRKTNEQLRLLKREFHAQLYPVCMPMSMKSPKKLSASEETSQRARSFLFVAVGGVVAWAARSSAVEIYESGIGAINAPLLAGTEGSQATRSTHPKFLKLMSRLLGLAAEHQIDVVLPYIHLTKGEVAKSLAAGTLPELARLTVSCAHYPIRKDKGVGVKSCGICPACIFRRVALHSVGIEELGNGYEYDLLNPQSCPVDWKHNKYLDAFLNQIDGLAVTDEGRLPSPVAQHLIRTEVVRVEESQQAFVDLYRRYRGEWLRFVKQARLNGCGWANRIDLPGQAA
jgi:7-cyano-7-deazaguanine synthase in queuosine biosynthesis